MSAVDPVGAAPEARSPAFLWLLLGCIAAPVFWLGQAMLSYVVSAAICYPGDAPQQGTPGYLSMLLIWFDAIALGAGLIGGAVAVWSWRHATTGRNRFLAIWGLMSSLWFLVAILFNVIASVMVPLCTG